MRADQIKQTYNDDKQQNQNADMKQELQKITDLKQMEHISDANAYFKALDKAKQDDVRKTEQNDRPLTRTAKKADKGSIVLARLAVGLSKIGMDFTQNIGKSVNVDDEMDSISVKSAVDEDSCNISNTSTQDAIKNIRKRKEKDDERNSEKEQKSQDPASVKQLAQKYANTYAAHVVSASSDHKDKLDDLEKKLRNEGLSEGDISGLERGVRKSLRKDMTSQIQSCFFNAILSPKKGLELAVNARKYQESIKYAIQNSDILGINDAEGVKDHVSEVIDNSHGELRDFVHDHLENTLLAKNISKKDVKDEIKMLTELGVRVGFNYDQFVNNWLQKRVDLGIVAPNLFQKRRVENKAGLSIGNVNAGGVSDRHGYEMTKDEEKELLMNRFRALNMKQALTGKFEGLQVSIRIKKTKNGLIKLGVTYEDMNRLEKEGKALARYRSFEQLKEAFMERSTFYQLSGSAYDLVRDKTKGIISNLKRLGYEVSKDELDMFRDDANRQMFDQTVMELKSAMAVLKQTKDVRLQQKVQLMMALLKRIKEESGFNEALGEDIDTMVFRYERQLKEVRESA